MEGQVRELQGIERLLTAGEVAELLGVSRTKVYELMASGRLRSVKLGRPRRVTPAALREFFASLDGSAA